MELLFFFKTKMVESIVCFLLGNSPASTQTPRNYPEENIKHLEHGESLKSRMMESVVYSLGYLV